MPGQVIELVYVFCHVLCNVQWWTRNHGTAVDPATPEPTGVCRATDRTL